MKLTFGFAATVDGSPLCHLINLAADVLPLEPQRTTALPFCEHLTLDPFAQAGVFGGQSLDPRLRALLAGFRILVLLSQVQQCRFTMAILLALVAQFTDQPFVVLKQAGEFILLVRQTDTSCTQLVLQLLNLPVVSLGFLLPLGQML